jgi:hypothetical protein
MKYLFILPILILTSISLSAQINITNSTISGYKVMSLPRKSLPVGAIWNKVTGPNSAGAPAEHLLENDSFESVSMISQLNQSGNVELGILNFLQSGGYFKSLTSQSMEVTALKIVTLNSPEVLKSNVGNTIIYEALKVDEIKITVKKNNTANAKAELSKLFKDLNVSGQADRGNETEITAKGLNLFIAYRLVLIDKAKSSEKKLKFKHEQNPQVDKTLVFGSNYDASTPDFKVGICPCSIIQCVAGSQGLNNDTALRQAFTQCGYRSGWDFSVTLKKRISPKTGTPETYNFKVKSGLLIKDQNLPLYYISTSDGLETAYLSVEQLSFTPMFVMGKPLAALSTKSSDAISSIKITTFTFKEVKDQNVRGW